MRIKFGPDDGNSGAVIRWGKHLDAGIWFRGWRYRRLWLRWKPRYGDFGFVVIRPRTLDHLEQSPCPISKYKATITHLGAGQKGGAVRGDQKGQETT